MQRDTELSKINYVFQPVLNMLLDLGIRTIRQLYPRLMSEGSTLQNYLHLSDKEFARFRENVKHTIEEYFPEDTLSQVHPRVNKRGVAVHRLDDPSRPHYYKDDTDD